jgi:hypothetical protein
MREVTQWRAEFAASGRQANTGGDECGKSVFLMGWSGELIRHKQNENRRGDTRQNSA